MLGGYHNRVAWVDLTAGTVEYKPVDEDDVRKYLGARGLGVKYVFDNGPEVDPFSPDNILCFMTGPLTGTDVKMSGRVAVVTKSPLTGTVVDSHHGGWSGARLKWAGLDGIVKEIDPTDAGFGPFDTNAFTGSKGQREKPQCLPKSLGQALEALAADHDFLLAGDVMDAEFIQDWIDFKMVHEHLEVRDRPHPYEMALYFDA